MKSKMAMLLVGLMTLGLLAAAPAAAETSLVAAVDTPPRMMNPHGDDSDAGLSFMANFFDGLLQRKGPDGKLMPALAERWEHPDLLTWRFYLRKGVTFHNGNPFTAQDVKFTFERLKNPEVSEFLNTGKSIDSIRILDDYTVEIKTKKPIPWFANNLHQIFIMDKESTEKRDPGDVMIHPIGTGAYKLVEWVKGSYVRMEANENYWEGAPAIKKVEVRPITEASTRFAALVSGQADIMTGVPVELFDKIQANPKLQVISRPARRSIFLALGNKPGDPWSDIRVRKAMYMAINEDEIIQKVMRGHATPAAQIPDPPTIGYNAAIQRLPYDPEGAKKLLKEAGYENGFEITLTGPNDRYVQDEKIAEAVAKYLAKVGIKVKLDVKPKSIFFPEVAEGKLQFYLIGWFDGTFDMGRTYFKLAHTRDDAAGFGGLNGASYSDPKLDQMLEATADMVDPAQRKKALEELNRYAMEEKIVWIPLHYQEDLYAMQKGKGIVFQPRPDRWIVYKEIGVK
ncbi:peptide/nickel transport system substrate-binding protein [Desulfacinum hydrothermale DSM 13146]|uniref:Peptide/nickel transport system substrate-binding protein n=1 Tax=Desulfacinum hydrothermale DSM 13146 TaxID=1121390 RepID=A0A1W1WYI7_9BACT|nr:ABC transporter substrate-binding protein [Desulfacinum hydrothermale]SMC16714.1 peptide/nickel transport system substrate-binding protein [Desulfacinum hydrothermale DSM 13146]